MCEAFSISRDVVLSLMSTGEPFSDSEIKKRIKEKKGVMRIAPNYTVKDYLKDFEDDGILKYNDGKYRVTSE